MPISQEQQNEIIDSLIEAILDDNEDWFRTTALIGLDVEVGGGDGQPITLTLVFFGPIDESFLPPPGRIDITDPFEKTKEKFPEIDEIDFDDFVNQKLIGTSLTRVEDFGEDEFLTIASTATSTSAKIRPCPGGILICVKTHVAQSTLGGQVRYNGPSTAPTPNDDFRLIGSNHALSNDGRRGQSFHQPEINAIENEIATDLDFKKITYSVDERPTVIEWNQVDISWAEPISAEVSAEIQDLGAPAGIRKPVVGEIIDLRGAICKEQRNLKVLSVNFRYRTMNNTAVYSFWKRSIRLDDKVTQKGDCGAAYVAQSDNKIVAIHRAYVGNHSVGNPLLIVP